MYALRKVLPLAFVAYVAADALVATSLNNAPEAASESATGGVSRHTVWVTEGEAPVTVAWDSDLRRDVDADPPPSSTAAEPTVTVTVTPVAPPPDVTVIRTYTRTTWTSTSILNQALNCTRTVYAAASTTAAAPPVATSPSAPAALAGPPEVIARQVSGSSSSATSSAAPTSSTPAVTPVPTVRPARTRTVWSVVTATQTGDFVRTRYQCATTLAYLYTVDATTTLMYTLTSYSSTLTATSTVTCPGYNGFAASVPTAAATGAAAPPAATENKLAERQGSSSTAAPPTTPTASVSLATVLTTQTIHLTRTAYSLITINATAPATSIHYECATPVYDATVTYPVIRTAWPSTTTVVSYVNCGPSAASAPIPFPPASQIKDKRQTSTATPTPTATPSSTTTPPVVTSATTTTHRTKYVYATVTITQPTPFTVSAYSCAAAPSPSPSKAT